MAITNIASIRGDRPFPFIFASRNFALSKHGAKASWVGYGGSSTLSSDSEISNVNDGNRGSYAQFERVDEYYDDNFIDIRLDLSDVDVAPDEKIDLFSLQMEPGYGCRQFEITSYTNSDFSTGALDHNYTTPQYLTSVDPDFYQSGTWPRCDDEAIRNGGSLWDGPQESPEGFDGGQNVWWSIGNPIDLSTRKWIRIKLVSPNNNLVGWAGTWDDGLWPGSVDEVLTTSDPAGTGEGTNNNHVRLFTDTGTGGHQQDQEGMRLEWRLRNKFDTYMLTHMHRQDGFDAVDGDGYQIQISYYDHNFGPIFPQDVPLYIDGGGDAISQWKPKVHLINWRDTDGLYYSGEGSEKHLVPAGAAIVLLSFYVLWDSNPSADELSWKIDDLAVFNHSKVLNQNQETYQTMIYDNKAIKVGVMRAMDGIIRINRICLSQYKFATSRANGKISHISDLAGRSGANPTTLSESSRGKIIVPDINGNIVAAFVPKSGIKRDRNVSMVGSLEFKEAISRLDYSSEPFVVIDPQSDFGDYIIRPGSMTWAAIDPPKHLQESPADGISFEEAADFFWNGKLVLQEV